ncbi:MAG: glycosyl hydrolase, partial [Maribacter sp.]
KAWDDIEEIPNQIELARETPEIQGNIMFSAKSLMKDNDDVVEYMHKKYYKKPALNPVSTLSKNHTTRTPKLLGTSKTDSELILEFNDLNETRFALFYTSGIRVKETYDIKKLRSKIYVDNTSKTVRIPLEQLRKKYNAITFIDVYGKETTPIIFNLKQVNK